MLPDPLKLRGLPRGAALAVHLEAVHMTQAENSGRHTPIIIIMILINNNNNNNNTHQGGPRREQTPTITPTTSMSRW